MMGHSMEKKKGGRDSDKNGDEGYQDASTSLFCWMYVCTKGKLG